VTSQHRWAAATGVYAALILVISLMPITVEAPDVPQLDKLIHLGEYLLFAWLLGHARQEGRQQHTWAQLGWHTWVGSAGYGALMELMQAALPWRSASGWDQFANMIGAGLGSWLAVRSAATR
jgi:VanZ family protein